jgi:CubicO group peptidase (beta-lactamase class C family)
MKNRSEIHGTVAPGFEPVRHAFAENFARRKEAGAACAVFLRGEKVVDLWGGVRNLETNEPWEEDTIVLVFSTTKGMAATAVAVAHSRGLFDLDERVATYWPEFAQHGKGSITVRQLLAHEAGLCCIDEPFDATILADLDRVARALAAQRPAWTPGTKHGYHSISLGWYEGELIRRVDPKKRSLGRFFHDEVATRLGVDFHIGLPKSVPSSRVATIKGFRRIQLPFHMHTLPWRFLVAVLDPRSLASRSLNNPKLPNPDVLDRPEYRAVEMPASNGIGNARAIARIYGALATGGGDLGLKPSTMDAITTPGRSRRDEVLKVDTAFAFGFLKPSAMSSFGSKRSFGTPGAGGSFGFADPDLGLGFAYVMNRMGFHLADDPREKALRDATYECVRHSRP